MHAGAATGRPWCSGRLASGTWIEITDGDDPLRLAVGSERPRCRGSSRSWCGWSPIGCGLGRGAAAADLLRDHGRPARSGPGQPAVIVVG